jgi:hypothetical protein
LPDLERDCWIRCLPPLLFGQPVCTVRDLLLEALLAVADPRVWMAAVRSHGPAAPHVAPPSIQVHADRQKGEIRKGGDSRVNPAHKRSNALCVSRVAAAGGPRALHRK